jgi:hypothetical protein
MVKEWASVGPGPILGSGADIGSGYVAGRVKTFDRVQGP